ncbi:MAG: hypothetical protein WDO15_16525 [Bacteroidota bacterium]
MVSGLFLGVLLLQQQKRKDGRHLQREDQTVSIEDDKPTVALKFIEPSEIQKIFGGNVTLYFDKGTSELTPNQNKVLSKIATGLASNKDIYCRLVALKKEGGREP